MKGHPFFQKVGTYSQRAGADEEIPPGVLEARRKLGWSHPEEVSPSALGTSSSSSAGLGRSRVSSAHLDLVMATESGEVLKRRRAGGPWIPDAAASTKLTCAWFVKKLSLEIAGSLERRGRAVAQFEDLVYAPATLATKVTLFKLWIQICEKCGLDLYLSPAKVFG